MTRMPPLELSVAHEKDPTALQARPITWQRPDDVHDYRTCSYCRSIHPADLLSKLQADPEIRLADMRFGWPSKFYTGHGDKFHSAHLLDAAPPVFNELCQHLMRTGVEFSRDAVGALYYQTHLLRAAA